MSRTKKISDLPGSENDGSAVNARQNGNDPLPPITHDDLGTPEDRREQHTNGDTPPVPKEPKDAKFFRLAIKRVPFAIKRIRHVANLANRNQYEYTEAHAAKIIDALETELRALKQAFSGTKTPAETWTL